MERQKSHRHKVDAGQPRIAVVYARVSSKEQEKEGFSILALLQLLRGDTADHRLTVIAQLIDVETAERTGRHSFTAMMAARLPVRSRRAATSITTVRVLRGSAPSPTHMRKS